MKFGDTEYSLREFGDAKLLKKEAESVVKGYIEALGAQGLTDGIASKVAELRKHVGPKIPFYTWIVEQCDQEINAHIKRLEEIYAETITNNTAPDSNSDHIEVG